jgi:2-polyprenyl-3-methyl-5-hydroxy-6-metoxy-1,4-benzoquinol methylase
MTRYQCPVCNDSEKYNPLLSTRDGFTIVGCPRCGTARLDPIPSLAEIRAFYPPDYYGATTAKFIAPIEHILRYFSARTIARASKNLDSGSRLLDIGCGRGVFLCELLDRGFEVHGTELSNFVDQPISNRCTIHVTDSLSSLEFPTHSFDMVILWHVLEHLPNPQETISEISRILSPGGRLAVAVPNYGSLQSRVTGRYWFHLDLPRHIFHFTQEGLRTLLTKNGFITISANHFSLIQNGFGWIQSILNRVPGLEVNCLYDLLHMRSHNIYRKLVQPRFIVQLILAVLISPLALLLSLAEGLTQNGGTVELLAKKYR